MKEPSLLKEASPRKIAKLERLLRLAEIRIGYRYDENGIRLAEALKIIDEMRDDFFAMKKTNTINAWVAEWFVKWLDAKPREEQKE